MAIGYMERAMMALPGWVHEDVTPYVAQSLYDAELPLKKRIDQVESWNLDLLVEQDELVEALRQLSATRGTSYAAFIGALDAADALLAKYEVICDGPDTKTEDRAIFEDTLR